MEHLTGPPEDAAALIDQLEQEQALTKAEWVSLIKSVSPALSHHLFDKSASLARKHFGNKVYIRGLIEVSNYCKNNCYYCGIRAGNAKALRYRLTAEDILACCQAGYELGFRTFVLQGGEDPGFTDESAAGVVASIKDRYPDCAVTLSLGEKSRKTYQMFYEAGADRYLLRHETADPCHYKALHPPGLALKERMRCLWDLKEIGFQTGTGFMVGSPYQTPECLAEDMLFIRDLSPQMVGIGPFLPHQDTPFGGQEKGSLTLTLFLLGLLRLMLPKALLPATTALGTLSPDGREKGILAGANVVMPNLSPLSVRKKYMLYDNKISTGEEAAEGLELLKQRLQSIGYIIPVDRGDYSSIDEG